MLQWASAPPRASDSVNHATVWRSDVLVNSLALELKPPSSRLLTEQQTRRLAASAREFPCAKIRPEHRRKRFSLFTARFLPHAVNCGRFWFCRRQSVLFWLCMKYLGNCSTDLRQIHTEDVFRPSLGWVWTLRSNVKGQGHQEHKRHFSAISAARVRFMYGKTSLASCLTCWNFCQVFHVFNVYCRQHCAQRKPPVFNLLNRDGWGGNEFCGMSGDKYNLRPRAGLYSAHIPQSHGPDNGTL